MRPALLKKGQIHQYWVQLLIGVAVILIFLLFFNFINSRSSILKDQACAQSIQSNIRGHLGGITLDSEIKCSTNLEPIKAKDEEKKKEAIAEKMNSCWTKFEQGKQELFSENKIYCSICDVVTFQDKGEIKGFGEYLINTKVPGKQISYIDYFSGHETPKVGEAVSKLNIDTLRAMKQEEIDPDKTYAVIFVYAKGKNEIEKVVRHTTGQTTEGKLGLVLGAGVGTFAGASVGIAVVALGSNPVGWAIGTAIVVGIATDAALYFLSSDNHPEWASFILFKEYNAQSLKELNCQEIK